MNVVFESDRLIFRRFTKEDASLIFELNQDPEVIRYTLDPMVDLAHAQKVLDEVILPQYIIYNFGRWAVHLKTTKVFIGWCGLKFRAGANEIDLGYRFMKKYWGNGYATEAAIASLDYGIKVLKLKRIVGRALPGNVASIHVLKKSGMKYVGQEVVEGLLHETYELSRP